MSGWGWRRVAPAANGAPWPSARVSHTATYNARDGRAYVFGGSGDGSSATLSNDLWAFDAGGGKPGTASWARVRTTGAAPSPRWIATAAFVGGGATLVVVGGQSGGTFVNDAYALDLASGAWTRLEAATGAI